MLAKRYGVYVMCAAMLMVAACKSAEETKAVEGQSFTNGIGMRMIKLSTGYYVSKYETRQKEFEEIMGVNPSSHKGPNKPVEHLTGDEAVAFCEKLTAEERKRGTLPAGYVYRLPTFRQWKEYVADASLKGSVTPDNYPGGAPSSELDVGSGEVNRLGIYDLRGNVSEYSCDTNTSYPGSALEGTHVILGASWNETRRDFLAIDNKGGFAKVTDRSLDVGFRCVLVREESTSP